MGAGASTNHETKAVVTYDEFYILHQNELSNLLKNAVGIQQLFQFATSVEKTFLLEIWECFGEYRATPNGGSALGNKITYLLSAHLDLFPMTNDFVKSCLVQQRSYLQ